MLLYHLLPLPTKTTQIVPILVMVGLGLREVRLEESQKLLRACTSVVCDFRGSFSGSSRKCRLSSIVGGKFGGEIRGRSWSGGSRGSREGFHHPYVSILGLPK